MGFKHSYRNCSVPGVKAILENVLAEILLIMKLQPEAASSGSVQR